MGRRGRRRRWPWVVLFATIALVGLFYVAGSWYFTGQVHEQALAAVPYDPASLQGGRVEAVELSGGTGTITLSPDPEHADDTSFDDAVVGLAIGESLVVAGPASVGADGTRTRPVVDVVGPAPRRNDTYGLTRDVWLSPEQAGLDARDVTIRTLDGREFPAWEVPGRDPSRWAVLTHGKGASRTEMLRMARPLHRAGFTVLMITYSGDTGAPPAQDGMLHYGRTEWVELEAAVQYALDQEATTIVLGGASHGGAATLGFLARSPVASNVDAVILDAPVSSLGDVIDEAGESRSIPVVGLPIPESLEDATKLLVAFRYGVDFSAVDYTDMEGLVDVPLLTFQGSADQTVPERVNDRFMREGSGQDGTYVVVPGAGHVMSWNLDPAAYEKRIRQFVAGLTG